MSSGSSDSFERLGGGLEAVPSIDVPGLLTGAISDEIAESREAVNTHLDFNGLTTLLDNMGADNSITLANVVFVGMEAQAMFMTSLAVEAEARGLNLKDYPKGAVLVANAISEKIGCTLVARFGRTIPRSGQIAQTVGDVANEVFVIASTKNGMSREEAYGVSKEVVTIGSDLINAKAFRETLSEYSLKPRERKEAARLGEENDVLFENIRILQTYQMKSALIKASGAGRLRDWMVHEPSLMIDKANEIGGLDSSQLFPASGTLGRFYGTNYEFVSSIPVFEKHGVLGNGLLRINFDGVIRGHGGGSPAPNLVVELDIDGHLKGVRGVSFKDFAGQLGMAEEYELIRGEVLAIFCDLGIPAYLIDEAAEAERGAVSERHGKDRDIDKIRRLVIARTRLIQSDPERIKKAIKNENRKSPDLHSVVGFIRPLPRGYRATAEARENCLRELNKELAPEGETYVKNHDRGGNASDEDSEHGRKLGHRAVRRNVGGLAAPKLVQIKFS